MDVTPYVDRARTARLHKQNSVYWAAIGRTTPWPDEENPPSASPGATDIEEAIVFVRPQTVSLVKTVTSGEDVIVSGQKYAFVADEDAIAEGARFIYFKIILDPASGMPTGNYRQKAIFTDLVPAAGHEADLWLAPANVASRGVLGRISNTPVRSFGPGEQRMFELIRTFQ